ncbi:LysE family translocator [Cognatishimia activa]|uniref:Homoserine/homoserine lactone efflux protein n=1 Tax=Cognatishimia activa TaxID=1715691 RepID=A0A0P1ILI6_9RHOB|nr:LysE family translocator [Cognatishimia activa]CUI38416.1 Homoserine/homoserine lactone efflux protein [Cognatishimia activa]CUK24497.1 Homoserine/homoserine lactone efflux protein [Cognatishimia activa]
MPIDILVTFSVAVTLLALAPGPDNLFVLTQSALNGAKSGIWVVLGLCSGLFVHSAAVALGLAALLQTSAMAFTLIKFAGAAYLIYLAYQAFHAPVQKIGEATPKRSAFMLYRRGLIMNITNPKVAIFFLAFFPQFTDPANGAMIGQIATLGVIFVVMTFVVLGGIALVAGGLSERIARTPTVQLWMNRVAGLVFIGLAAKIATSEQ